MNIPSNDLSLIQRKLLQEKKKAEETLASLASQDPYADPDRVNDNAASDTEAKEESSHERVAALKKEMEMYVSGINQAFERIKRGAYGICMSCKERISIERLRVKPTALYCITCERKKEHV